MYVGTYSVTLPNTKPINTMAFTPNRENTAPQVQTAPKVPEYKNDSFISENKGKIAFGIGALALVGIGLFAAVATGRYDKFNAARMHKAYDKLAERAGDIQAEAGGIYAKARQTISEVSSYIQDGMQTGYPDVTDGSGRVLRKFTGNLSDVSDIAFLEEFDELGRLARRTSFDPDYYGMIDSIDEFTSKGVNRIDNICCNDSGEISEFRFLKGFTRTVFGREKSSKLFRFEDGTLAQYMEGQRQGARNVFYKTAYAFDEDGTLDKISKRLRALRRTEKVSSMYDAKNNIIMSNYNARKGKAGLIYSFDMNNNLEGAAARIRADQDGNRRVLGRLFEYTNTGEVIRHKTPIGTEVVVS